MISTSALVNRWRALLRRRAAEAELDKELRWHLQQIVERKLASGLPLDAARRAARLQFGNLESLKERCREIRDGSIIESTLRDLRVGLRMLLRYPLLSLATSVSIASTVAVTCTVFTIFDATLVRPSFPAMDPRNVAIVQQSSRQGLAAPFSGSDYAELKQLAAGSLEIAAEEQISVVVEHGAGREFVAARVVSANFFDLLRIPVDWSEGFPHKEGELEGVPTCILGFGAAAQYFGLPASALGRDLVIDALPHKVIGVLPRELRFIGSEEIVLPLRTGRQAGIGRAGKSLYCFAARADRATPPSGQEINELVQQLALRTGSPASRAITRPLADTFSHNNRPQLLILGAIAGVVLLTGCATAAMLNRCKVATRWRELGLRLGLGADSRRVLRQLLVEDVTLMLPAAVLGVLVTELILRLVRAVPFGAIHPAISLRLTILHCLIALTVAIAIALSAVAPLIGRLNESVTAAVSNCASYRATTGRRSKRRWYALITTQAAVSFLTVGAACALLFQFVKLHHLDLGFDIDRLFVIQLPSASDYMKEGQIAARTSPGVVSAAYSAGIPVSYLDPIIVTAPGQERRQAATGLAMLYATTPQFIDTLRIQVLHGRFFDAADEQGTKRVAVVDESLEQAWFPGVSAVGEQLLLNVGTESFSAEIIGVLHHLSQYGPAPMPDSEMQVYVSLAQLPPDAIADRLERDAHLVFRVDRSYDSQAVANTVAARLHKLRPHDPVLKPESMRDRVDLALNPRWTWVMLFVLSAGVALFLALGGIYAVTAYAMTGQARETCIRIALGCTRAHIFRSTCGPVMKSVFVGIIFAAALALLAQTMLPGLTVDADDLLASAAAAAAATIGGALAASIVPVARGGRPNLTALLNLP